MAPPPLPPAPAPRRPADLKPLYSSSSKAALLGDLFERLAASLESTGALPPLAGGSGSGSGSGAGDSEPAPQALVWCVRGPPWGADGALCGLRQAHHTPAQLSSKLRSTPPFVRPCLRIPLLAVPLCRALFCLTLHHSELPPHAPTHAPSLPPRPAHPPRRALFYLAQHHNKLGDTARALALVDRCIQVRGCSRRRLRTDAGWAGEVPGSAAPPGCAAGGCADAMRPPRCPASPRSTPPPSPRRAASMLMHLPNTSPHPVAQHTPTLIEAHVAKSKILKHAGEGTTAGPQQAQHDAAGAAQHAGAA